MVQVGNFVAGDTIRICGYQYLNKHLFLLLFNYPLLVESSLLIKKSPAFVLTLFMIQNQKWSSDFAVGRSVFSRSNDPGIPDRSSLSLLPPLTTSFHVFVY